MSSSFFTWIKKVWIVTNIIENIRNMENKHFQLIVIIFSSFISIFLIVC